MGQLVVLTPTEGDRRVPWDPKDPLQVEQAREAFRKYLAEGYRAYRVERKGQPGERVVDFDPEAAEILFTGKHGYVGG